MRPRIEWTEYESEIAVIAAGTQFTSEDLTFWQGRRTLDEALAEADLLVTCPHSGSGMPEEIASHIVPEFHRRFQFDFTDMTTAAIVRRWAEIDPKIIYIENPHPRLVRDPNRDTPEDLEAVMREAFRRVDAAGAYRPVDLSGVDAVRPVTFGFFPVLREPKSDAEWAKMVADFKKAAALGVDVYEALRVQLTHKMIELALARGKGAHFTTLSFHDTMNTTAERQGAIAKPRAPEARLPNIVALSNRGDHQGNARPEEAPTMNPSRLRLLAEAHREGFDAALEDEVLLNQPYLGSREIGEARDIIAKYRSDADKKDVALDAVQAEFNRECLMGAHAAVYIQQPGTDWPATDHAHVEKIAQACKASWDLYRARVKEAEAVSS